MSINLCTDQIAMMLAAPGQLVSVSHLALDPLSSSMAEEAGAYVVNRGQAEQVYLLAPDLVLAGQYNSPATIALLRGFGIRVEQVAAVTSLDGVPGQVRAVARALSREAEGEALVAEFAAGLAALAEPRTQAPPISAALYYPNGYTSGEGTLADDVLAHVGLENIGARAGLSGGGILALERLVLAAPQLIVTSTPYPGASRSEEILRHPALARLREGAGVAATTDADWVCGTPHVLRAVAAMARARAAFEARETPEGPAP
ncbi:ABC transporter substrate-binding protein [Pseudogemmobacter sonorensis]|uniref:ABC transporter substrate-binding protein n=1 Tax=Pseudogemmobacter sonorensis TaxID=2989681 RepID=UPI00369206A2